MLSFLVLIACQPMSEPGAIFEQVDIQTTSEEKTDVVVEQKEIDPLFADPQEEVLMGEEESEEKLSEEGIETQETDSMEAKGGIEEERVDVAQTDEITLKGERFRVSRVKDGWKPTLIASIMDGPTPRAILALPSGEEKVVKAGELLSEEGVVVMSIGESFVELVVVNAEEGRATIENVTLSKQF